jgi:hypothetical protein
MNTPTVYDGHELSVSDLGLDTTPAPAPAPAAGIVQALKAAPVDALVHLQGLITAVDDHRRHRYCQLIISDTTGSAIVHFSDDVTDQRRSELKVGRVLAVMGCPAGAHRLVAATWKTADVSLPLEGYEHCS